MSGAARRPFVEALGVASLAAILYVALASRYPGWGDAADLARRAVDGPLTPFGRSYALQSLAVRAFAMAMSPAAALAIVSALSAAVGTGIVYWGCRSPLGLDASSAAGAALTLGFSHTYASSAVDGEVYALLGALTAATAVAALAARRYPTLELGAGALAGLAASHHRAALVLIPLGALWLSAAAASSRRRIAAFRFTVGVLLGCVPLFILVAMEASRDPSTPLTVLLHKVVFGAARNADLFFASERSLSASLVYVAKWLVFNLPGPALAAVAIGWACVARDHGRRAALGVGVVLASLSVLPLRFDGVGDRYALIVPLYPLVALLAGIGVQQVASRRTGWGIGMAVSCALAPMAVYMALGATDLGPRVLPRLRAAAATEFFIPSRWGAMGSSIWARETLDAIPIGGTIFAEWGAGGALDYARRIDGIRVDVRVVRHMPASASPVGVGTANSFVALTPIWSDESARLATTGVRAERVGPSLYRLHAAR